MDVLIASRGHDVTDVAEGGDHTLVEEPEWVGVGPLAGVLEDLGLEVVGLDLGGLVFILLVGLLVAAGVEAELEGVPGATA